MSDQEIERSDVIIVLHTGPGHDLASQVNGLKAIGLQVGNIDADNAVVEGTIKSAKLPALAKLPSVKYRRIVFNYMTETPETAPQPNSR